MIEIHKEIHKDETPITFREGVRGVWRHLRPYRRSVVAISLLGFVSAAANGAIPFITGRFFDALIALSQGKSASAAGFQLWVILLALWALIQLVANNIDWIIDRLKRKITLSIHLGAQVVGFIHLFRLPISYHTHTHINGELSKISGAAWRIDSMLDTVIMVAPQFLSILIGLALAASINGTLAGILAVGVLTYVLVLTHILIPVAKIDSEAHRVWNNSWNDAAAMVTQIQSIKQAAAEEYEEQKIKRAINNRSFRLWYQLEMVWSNMNFYQRITVFLTQLAIFIISVHYVVGGIITVGDLVALNGYALMFFGPIVALGHSWQTIQNGLTAAGETERIFEISPEIYHPAGARSTSAIHNEVIFENVSFRYEEDQADILSHFDFTAAPGQMIAFVGETGVGKSTAISLISGFYFPREGSVRVDGIDTRQWDLTALRSRIANVPQEVALFNDTIRENIRYGTFDASDDAVEVAAKKAYIHDFVMTQPKKYDTLVGERGIKLSVGQKQRVAIARAILRNPEFLILDEPTSALDSKTEQLITNSIEKLMKGRTTFIAAHRLSTVRKADIILMMKDGTVVERGSHTQLMAIENGVYRHLYEYHIGFYE